MSKLQAQPLNGWAWEKRRWHPRFDTPSSATRRSRTHVPWVQTHG